MQTHRLIIAATLASTIALAACDGGRKEEEAGVNNATIADNVVTEVDETPAPGVPGNSGSNSTASSATPPAAGAIPVALQGRWGMVPKDCGPDAAIAKGLMTIKATELRFYESVGKPAVVTYPTPSRMEGRFTFTGEGMEWSKDMTLSAQGDKLVRTEKDPAVSYTYTRCPA